MVEDLTRGAGLSTTSATMQIIRQLETVSDGQRGATVALGNFDGIHLGHQAVIGAACEKARAARVPSGVMTFAPHPRRFFDSQGKLFELTPSHAKSRHLAALGVDLLFLMQFDRALAAMPAERFVSDILVAGAGVSHVITGYDFVFGQGRKGDVALLKQMGDANEFAVTIVSAIKAKEGIPYSSTVIRDHLRQGRPGEAAKLLGRYWEIEGEVQTGEQRGRQIGFPTANVDPGDYVMPGLGVYAVRVGIVDGESTDWRDGVVNVGRRPTFDGEGITVEAHLFDFDRDLYGETLRVAFIEALRPELKFDGIEAICAQIEKDCAAARIVLEACSTDNDAGNG